VDGFGFESLQMGQVGGRAHHWEGLITGRAV
jgi:hypothetical protein